MSKINMTKWVDDFAIPVCFFMFFISTGVISIALAVIVVKWAITL